MFRCARCNDGSRNTASPVSQASRADDGQMQDAVACRLLLWLQSRGLRFARPVSPLRPVLTRHWRRLGQEIDVDAFTDAQATAVIARLTGGNFRLLHRLFVQIDRVVRINELTAISEDVVETAASALVIGHAT